MLNEYSITEEIPQVSEYLALRSAVQWKNPSPETASSALTGSLFCVCIRHNSELIGFGRVLGDGHFNFYIQDMIIHPDHQSKGLGCEIMNRIMSYIDNAGGDDACIGLMAAKGVAGFYEQFGFSTRPADAPGMQKLPAWRIHKK